MLFRIACSWKTTTKLIEKLISWWKYIWICVMCLPLVQVSLHPRLRLTMRLRKVKLSLGELGLPIPGELKVVTWQYSHWNSFLSLSSNSWSLLLPAGPVILLFPCRPPSCLPRVTTHTVKPSNMYQNSFKIPFSLIKPVMSQQEKSKQNWPPDHCHTCLICAISSRAADSSTSSFPWISNGWSIKWFRRMILAK